MQPPKFTVEHALHFLAISVAVGVRFLELGTAPLTESEAALAVQAIGVARGNATALTVSPGYSLATGLIFLLGNSAVLARLVPAAAGVLLVALPFAFRHRLGRTAALVLAFAIAVDPGMVALSRQAGGVMLAVAFGGAALAAWEARRATTAGIFGGLAILSGPAIFGGVMGLAAAGGLARLMRSAAPAAPAGSQQRERSEIETSGALRTGILSGGGTLLLAGTLFLRYPQGIAALTGSVPAFINGWVTWSDLPLLRQIVVLVFYHPLPLLFGTVHAAHAWKNNLPTGRLLSLWAAMAILFALLYPGRQVSDLAWALLPLWALAAMELARFIRWPVAEPGGEEGVVQSSVRAIVEDSWTAVALAAVLFVFLSYIWLNLLSLARLPSDPELTTLRWVLIGGAVLLSALASGLIGLGWGRAIANHGLVWGISAALGFYMLAASWQSIEPQARRSQELWWRQPVTIGEELLLETIFGISEWETGRRTAIPVTVLVDQSSLRWALRNFPEARFVERLGTDAFPDLVITAQDTVPQLATSYRGTDIGWTAALAWPGPAPPELLRWLMFRDAPEITSQLILWARNDLFLDGALEAVEGDVSESGNSADFERQDSDGPVQ